MMSIQEQREAIRGLDILHHAALYLGEQFDPDMEPEVARSHFQARAIIASLALTRCDELEEEIAA
jgi:hypothetical protein